MHDTMAEDAIFTARSRSKAELARNIEVDYDSKGDVLYINFGKPQEADDSDITEEGVVIRLKEGKIIGVTILNASKRMPHKQN